MSEIHEQNAKVWLITGANSGFGRALAEEILSRGQRVVLAVRHVESVRALVESAPERALAVRLDVTKANELGSALEQARARFGAIDVLVNNAGYSLLGALEETSEADLRDVMETMFFGPAALTRALVPSLRERRSGTIVQITSVGGFTTAPGFSAYCAAKHALEGLSECLAKELEPFGVRVLIVEPGAFRTRLFGPAFKVMPPLDAYAASVGQTRAYAAQLHDAQPGDPVKAARAIVDAVAAGAPTLRLPLGADAVDLIRQKLAQFGAEVSANEATARAASTPD